MSSVLLPGSIVAMTDQAADRLLRLDHGDAALLYLCLLRHGSPDKLSWPQPRLDGAMTALRSLGMAPDLPPRSDPPEQPSSPPEYDSLEISTALGDPASSFSSLCDEVERMLGKKLNVTELKAIFTLFDHLALPPEIILLLTGWCCQEMERKYGPGRKPPVSVIKKEGFIWARKGIDTMERAEAHMLRLSQLRTRENEVLRLLDISPRPLVEREKTYIAAWEDMGFRDDALRMAYEKTVMKKQGMDWGYMNGILRRWHEKGLHTAAAIQAGDHDARFRGDSSAVPPGQPAPQAQQDSLARMRKLLDQMKQEG